MRKHPDFRDRDLIGEDPFLCAAVARLAPAVMARQEARLRTFGRWAASEADGAAAYTDREAPPRLRDEPAGGDPADRLLVNPRYAAIHREAYRHGMVGLNHGPAPEPFLLTFTMGYLLSQADISVHCPVTLTGAVALVLDRLAPAEIRARWLEPLTRMDGSAWTGGTWATEEAGGSDVGASATAARARGGHFALSGLKFFCSNAGSNLAIATARPEGAPPGSAGLGLYLVPRITPDGAPNGYRIRRLKEKLGTRGLPTGEIELLDAYAEEVAPPPRGFKLMMEALEFSRVHNIFAAAGAQRRAFLEALGHACRRMAFGAPILSYPMVQATLLDLQMELEPSLLLALATADAFDRVWQRGRAPEEEERAWLRLIVAAAKYRTADQAVRAASAAIEMLGGIGYTEEYPTARLLRDAQVLTVWEGPSNIQALELLRILTGPAQGGVLLSSRLSEMLDRLPEQLQETAAAVRRLLVAVASGTAAARSDAARGQHMARRLLEQTADALSAALLLEQAGHDLARGDGRAAAVARRYVGRRVLHEQPEIAPALAESVLFYEPVPA
jgi:alkylation response protein AidB-like acyl-CoA dehydrogenase